MSLLASLPASIPLPAPLLRLLASDGPLLASPLRRRATAGLAALALYALLVRALRWRRYNAIHRKYKGRENKLTPAEAQEVVQLAFAWDMPKLSEYSLAFALFKTYAIPTISGLLLATRQLASPGTIARRYADTEILIATWVACPLAGKLVDAAPDAPVDDPRASLALARVNWLHSKYKISNDDFLYTLGLFLFEPAKWADKYGWRRHSELEKQARELRITQPRAYEDALQAAFVYWTEIGRKMNIADIPETPAAFRTWIEDYEREKMVPAESNRDVAEYTTGELLYPVPRVLGLRSFAEGFVRAMLDERTRVAMMQPKAPFYAAPLINTLMGVIALGQRYLALPRTHKPAAAVEPDLPPLVDGVAPRLFPKKWTSLPWYKPAAGGLLGHVRDRALVLLGWYEDVPRAEYRCAGYRIHEMGPVRYEKDGHEEVMRMAGEIQGCPVAKGWRAEAVKGVEGSPVPFLSFPTMPPRTATISSIYSWWSDSNQPGPTINLHTAAKPLLRLMYGREATKLLTANRGRGLTQQVLEELLSYLSVPHVGIAVKDQIVAYLHGRADSAQDTALLLRSMDNSAHIAIWAELLISTEPQLQAQMLELLIKLCESGCHLPTAFLTVSMSGLVKLSVSL
ncbi:hypothetical protein MIND_00580300 [Mycena indigotica]|uniref:ER-bound oxygenase mpaB/mpaB'/Rubber oxygenase catalytic domain-containing protein n=1 Tax=Mycena indigotica TaxID=2126181 RepID=A0A8H6W3E1_9AGAR|nr:uncharacterized protein MIND_00580300 [Mycena indigotica]KAF7303512.1 hypothetical protein MIND_00580300 [Mycena indigotica]